MPHTATADVISHSGFPEILGHMAERQDGSASGFPFPVFCDDQIRQRVRSAHKLLNFDRFFFDIGAVFAQLSEATADFEVRSFATFPCYFGTIILPNCHNFPEIR
ncbi:MAG: hypothetical protein J0M04_22895 [Verrucomicrobia bacterium]|nr:hypothetical protein [Verrucomicrobiota bacterium]